MRRSASSWLNLLWTFLVVSTLSLLAALLGCEPPNEQEDPAAYYGPAPLTDGGAPDACEPAAYYGPQPCASDEDCQTRHGDGWYCDEGNSYSDPCGNTTKWPLCRESVDAGVPDAGAVDGCTPATYYGPVECTEDADCVERHGEGWYCEADPSPCSGGGICREPANVDAGYPDASVSDGGDIAFYGPQSCQSDQECVAQNGAGWYCDEQNTVPDGSGGTVSWPVCKEE